jgi:hypothetical protein
MAKNTDTTKDTKPTDQNEQSTAPEGRNIQGHISSDLAYHCCDIDNVFVGAGDVMFELGDFHRLMPSNATISNRIVLSVSSAYELQNSLGQALANAQPRLQQNFNK